MYPRYYEYHGDWEYVMDDVVKAFRDGWARPHPHAWDDLLAEDVELNQPLLRCGRGREHWQREVARLLTFLPDVTAHVLDWARRGDTVLIEFELRATVAGRPVSVPAVDKLVVDSTGRVTRRDSFFDPSPVAALVARRPVALAAWWRSGVGPLLARRRVLRTKENV